MKSYIRLITVLAIITAGCTSSKKTAANRGDSLVSPNPAPDASEAAMDDEFDLIEEELDEQEIKISDPLRGLNRAMFNFNDKLYLWVLNPVAKGYKRVLPEKSRISVRNFFSNLTTPVRFVSCHLQGKHKAAGVELHRFAYNTTFGFLGFHDPAKSKLGLESSNEDLGQTLGKWGAGTGIYLVLPLLGPSNARDAVGTVGGQYLNPVRYVDPTEASIAISAVNHTNDYSLRLGEYESFKKAAYDPYIAMQRAYLQYREKQIQE